MILGTSLGITPLFDAISDSQGDDDRWKYTKEQHLSADIQVRQIIHINRNELQLNRVLSAFDRDHIASVQLASWT